MRWNKVPSGVIRAAESRLWNEADTRADDIAEIMNASDRVVKLMVNSALQVWHGKTMPIDRKQFPLSKFVVSQSAKLEYVDDRGLSLETIDLSKIDFVESLDDETGTERIYRAAQKGTLLPPHILADLLSKQEDIPEKWQSFGLISERRGNGYTSSYIEFPSAVIYQHGHQYTLAMYYRMGSWYPELLDVRKSTGRIVINKILTAILPAD